MPEGSALREGLVSESSCGIIALIIPHRIARIEPLRPLISEGAEELRQVPFAHPDQPPASGFG